MERDFSLFPHDQDGDALWHLRQRGVDLSTPREVDFSVLLPSKESAIEFAVQLLRCEEKVSCHYDSENAAFPMDVQVHPKIIPSHANISEWLRELASKSAPFGGTCGDWGFVA